MQIAPFQTEHFFDRYEFNTPYQLCNSDCETVSVAELMEMADMSLEQFGGLRLGYTESWGNPHLREIIAAAYDRISPEQLIMLGAPVEGIFVAAQAILNPGDEVIALTPAYDALLNMFEHVVGTDNVKRWAVKPTEAGWRLDVNDLRGLLSAKTKLVVVNFPHNPTGYLPSLTQMEEIAEIVEAHGLWLFYDEMYFGLIHSGTAAIPSAADVISRAIILSGLSKTYGLPGLRTGWLIVQDETLRKNIHNWKLYTSICPPAPSEFLAVAAWQAREELRQRNVAQIEANLALAEDFFQRWGDLFVWRRPMAGSVALIKMNVPSVTAFATKMAESAGILIHPAVTLGASDQHLRMGFGRAAFSQALDKFDAYLQTEIRG